MKFSKFLYCNTSLGIASKIKENSPATWIRSQKKIINFLFNMHIAYKLLLHITVLMHNIKNILT